MADGPPALKSEDHYHVFFYHSTCSEDQDQIEHYMSVIENRCVAHHCIPLSPLCVVRYEKTVITAKAMAR